MMSRVEELRALKDRRSRNREVRDFEERILLDNLEETERQLHGTPNNTYRKQLPLSKHEDLRQLQIEYERMREQERKMIQDLGPLHHRSTGRNSDASMSIHLLKDRSKYNPNNDPKLQSLAENHGKQMEFLSNRNRDLERQRDEIRRRLGDLGRKPPESDNTAALIAELRDQEARNQRLLEELKKQLLASRQPVAIIGEQQQVQQKKSFTYPIYYGNSLVAEISAIRQAYIQSGGDDPEILAQLAQMLAEAQAIEEAMRNKKPPEPKQKEKKTDFSAHIMTLDMENERLNRELYLLQEQNLMAKGRRKDDGEGRLPPIRFGLSGTMGSRLGLSNPLYGTLGHSSIYSSLLNPSDSKNNPLLYSSLGYKPLYSSLLGKTDSNVDTDAVLLNSVTGRASGFGRPGTGLGYRSLYRPSSNLGLYGSSFLAEGGHTLTSRYGLNPSIRDSIDIQNRGLVDIGTSPLSSSRLNRPLTSLGLQRGVIGRTEPHKRKPYPLDFVLGPPDENNIAKEEDPNIARSYMASTSLSQYDEGLRDSFENNDQYEYKATHPTVPKLKLYSDQHVENDSQKPKNNEPREKEEKQKKGLFSFRSSKKNDKDRPETKDSVRTAIVEPNNSEHAPLKSAMKKNGKTLEPTSAADLNNHPSNMKTYPEETPQNFDSDIIYDPIPDTVQRPAPRKPVPQKVQDPSYQYYPYTNSARPIPSQVTIIQPQPLLNDSYVNPESYKSPVNTTTPYLIDSPRGEDAPMDASTPIYIQPATRSNTIPPHPDTYRSLPSTINAHNGDKPTTSRPKPTGKHDQLSTYRSKPKPSPIPEENYSDRPVTIGQSSPSSYLDTEAEEPTRGVIHSYPKPPTDPSDPYNYYAETGWPPVEFETMHKDHKGYKPLNPEKEYPNNNKSEQSSDKDTNENNKKHFIENEKMRKKAEAEAKKREKVALDARKKAEAEAKKQAKIAEDAKKKAEAEARKQAKASEDARKKAEAEAKKQKNNTNNAKQNAQAEADQKAKQAQQAQAEAEKRAKQAKVEADKAGKNAKAEAEKRAKQAQAEAERAAKQTSNAQKAAQSAPKDTYRFKDNFVSRTKNDGKKAVSFSE